MGSDETDIPGGAFDRLYCSVGERVRVRRLFRAYQLFSVRTVRADRRSYDLGRSDGQVTQLGLVESVSLFAAPSVAPNVQDPNKIDDFALDLIGVGTLTIMFFVIGALGVALGNAMMGIGMSKNVAFTLSIAMTLVTAWLLFDYLDAQI